MWRWTYQHRGLNRNSNLSPSNTFWKLGCLRRKQLGGKLLHIFWKMVSGANEFDGIRMMLVVRFWLFSKFLQVFTLVVWRHSSPMTHEILLCWAGTIKFDNVWKRRDYPILSLSRHWNFVDASDAFSLFLNDRFRWSGYWPAEWCSARTKLVSYLYFAFISKKK